jgi:hypothetical protein
MGCMVSQLAAKFAFFPPSPPTYQIKKREDGKLTVVSSSTPSMPIPNADDTSLDVLLIDTKRGNKIVAFYLRNPYARLTLLYSHGNAADLGQLYDLFVQLKLNLRVNLMGSLTHSFSFLNNKWLAILIYMVCLNNGFSLFLYLVSWGLHFITNLTFFFFVCVFFNPCSEKVKFL